MTVNRWQGRVFLGRDENGTQRYHYVGRFRTRKERDEAVAREKVRIEAEGCDCDGCAAMGRKPTAASSAFLVGALVDRYLEQYAERNRTSSRDVQTERLKGFRKDFADRPVTAISRSELKDWRDGKGAWSEQGPRVMGYMPAVVSFFGWCVDDEDLPLPRNPARKLSGRGKGRSEQPPPTEEEFGRLIDACSVHGDYGPMVRSTFLYAAYQLARPSEVFELKESDIDFKRSRVGKNRRVYRGQVDEPKTGRKVTALTPPAREAIAPHLPGDGGYVFRNKSGNRLTATTFHGYWKDVLIRADLDFDFYLASKHYGVWFLWNVLGLEKQVIAVQAGWEESTVDKMLKTYGHADVGALEKIDKAFRDRPVQGLTMIEGGRR